MEEILKYENALTKRFLYKVTEDGIIYPQYETFPEVYGKVLNYFIGMYSIPSKVQQVIYDIIEHRERNNNKYFLGANDTTFLVEGETTTFYTEFVSGQPAIKLSTNDAINFFKRYKEWLIKFESGKIVGLTQQEPNKFKVVPHIRKPLNNPEKRTIRLKGNFFIKATISFIETINIINDLTNLNLKQDISGYYEELPAYSSNINLVEFALLGIPEKEYQMSNRIYDCYNFIIRDNNKYESHEWINYGENLMLKLIQESSLECYE